MADIRLKLDAVLWSIKDAQLILHGVRRDATGAVTDHVDIALPWGFQRTLTNFDGINYRSLEDHAD